MGSFTLNIVFLFTQNAIEVFCHKCLDVSLSDPRIFGIHNLSVQHIAGDVNAKQLFAFVLQPFHFVRSGNLIVGDFFNLLLFFLLSKRGIEYCLIDFLSHIAKNASTLANRAFKHTNALQATVINLCIDRVFCYKITDDNGIALLPATIDTTDSLFDCHRVPRKIIIDHKIAELIVQTFTADLCEQKDVQRIGIVHRKFKTFVFHTAVHLRHTVSFFCKMLLYIAKRMTERAEQDDLVVLLVALILHNFQQPVQLFIRLREIFRQFNHMICHCTELCLQRTHVQLFKLINSNSSFFIAAIRKDISQTARDHTFQQRRKTKNAAGSLPHERAHHKLQRHIVVQIAERMTFKIHQCFIKFFLLRGKMDRNALRAAHTEIVLNILTTGTIDHVCKAM